MRREMLQQVLGWSSRTVQAIAALALSCVLLAAPAGAGAAPLPLASAYVTDGSVSAVAIDGSGRSYIGGQFTQVGPRTGHGLKLASSSDQPASGFPDVNGRINAVVGDGSGGWFVGGEFTAVGGVTRNHLAHINGDGTLDATWDPNANGTVRALALSGSDLYVGGDFNGASSIGGQARNRIAKLATTGTGAADATWDPNANNEVEALALSGTDLYAGGDFSGPSSIGGQARNYIAKLATTGTGAADATWDPNANNAVRALAVSGTDLYAGGIFNGASSIGGQARNYIAKLATTGTGAADATWDPNANNIVFALAVSGTDVYAGGAFHGTNSIGGQTRNYIAKLATTGTGAADATWDPNANNAVRALAVSGTDLYAGGIFNGASSIGGQTRNRIAKLVTTGTGAADATWDPNTNGEVDALAVSGTDVYVGGIFSSAGAQNRTRNNIARLNSDGALDATWDPNANDVVDALAVSGTDVYVGGRFSGTNSIGGQARNHIAKLATTGTGLADASWDPNANDTVEALALSGTDLYVGGQFNGASSIGGQERNYIAKLTTTGTGAADATWDPNSNGSIDSLALSGTALYAGGGFNGASSIGGQERNSIAKLATTGTGAADPTWDPNSNGPVEALALSGTDLYAGGFFSGTNSIGGQARNYIAKLATTGTGAADAAWDPNPNGSIDALAVSGTDLYAGGFFSGTNSIGGQTRNYIAKLATTGTGAADAAWDPNPDGSIDALAVSGPRLVVGGDFTGVGAFSTQGIALLFAAPANTGLPLISGTATQGHRLFVSNGEWTNAPTAFARQWQRCNALGASCSSIAGATGTSYLLRAADVGHTLRVLVTASNIGGSTAARSQKSAKIKPAPPPVISKASFAASSFTAKTGTKLRLTLSQRAIVTVVVTQHVPGHRVAGKCSPKATTGVKCTLPVRRGKLSFQGLKGKNSFNFKLVTLKPGSYSARITARNVFGKVSKPVALPFKIK